MRKYFGSFTSYEFPDPFPPYNDPLSRLEFNFDQWFIGFNSGYNSAYWSMNVQGEINLNQNSSLNMQDSDWDHPFNPNVKTIFSESNNRLTKGWMAEVQFTIWTPIEEVIYIRPVLGYRYQVLDFTTHDGVQRDISGAVIGLPGESVEFEQRFQHFYLGGLFVYSYPLRSSLGLTPIFQLAFQTDCAIVAAKNEDLHLLRPGERITQETTTGYCWHLCLEMTCTLIESLRAGLEFDFKRMDTHGSHHLINAPLGIDFSFDGARVWSEQASVSAIAEITF